MTAALAGPVTAHRRAVRLALLLGTMVAAHSLLETARDTLFLSGQPIGRLPWLYLAVTAVVLPVTQLQSLAGRRRGGGGALLVTLLCSAVVTVGFWTTTGHSSGVNALYVWAALFSSVAFVQFWLVAVESFEVSEAKKLFGLVAAGGLVGAVAGNGAARLLLVIAEPRQLLLASATLMLVSVALLRLAAPAARTVAQASDVPVLRALPRALRTDGYYRLLFALALLPALAAIFIDFLFKATVATHSRPAEIPATIATAYLVQSAIALAVELLVARVLLRRSGVTRTLLLLPLGLLGVGAGFLVSGGLLVALALRTVDSGLRPSLNRVGTELLYLPISPAQRRILKPSIDALGQRSGQALGSLLILALLPLARATTWVGAALLLSTLGWLWVVRALRPRYLDRFREQLGSGRASALPAELDLGSAEVLVGALGSQDTAQVLAALELLGRGGRLRMIPALILYHPDPVVLRAALRLLAGKDRPDVAAMLPSLLRHLDPEVRAATAERWVDSGQPPAALQPLLGDPHPRVRAVALVALSSVPGSEPEQRSVEAMARNGTLEEQRELGRAIADSWRESLAPLLAPLFESADVQVRREVLRAARQWSLPSSFLPALVGLLPDSRLRLDAQAALVAMGAPALEHLGALLLDPDVSVIVERELPGAVASFSSQTAVTLLLRRIGEPRGGASRFRSLRALNRLRRTDPGLVLDRGLLDRALAFELSSARRGRQTRLQAMALGVSDQPVAAAGALLLDVLRNKESFAVERAFRVLQLRFPDHDLERVYLGTKSERPAVRGAATEVLVELLPSPTRERLLALLTDGASPPGPVSGAGPDERRRLAEDLLGSSSKIVRLLTARIAAEEGWGEVLPALEAAASRAAGDDLEVVLNAIARLEYAEVQAHG